MRLLRLPGTEIELSAICYSAALFGTGVQGAALDRLYGLYRDAGGNFFDTAHCYCFWLADGDGASERALGAMLRRFGGRDQIVIGSKGGHSAADGYPRPDAYLAPAVIAADLDDSLARLGVETIDLYYLHRDDTRVPVGEIIEMLNAEVDRGRIRALGASNWTTARIAAANAYAAAHGLRGFAASQPQWNLAQPADPPDSPTGMHFLTPGEVRWHATTGLPVVAYTPTAGGYFAGHDGAAPRFDTPVSQARRARARQLAPQLGCTPAQLALAWVMHHPFPAIPILGTLNPDHLADGLGAADVRLTPAHVRWLADG